MNAVWNTTMTDLLDNLREALAALVPMAERARIPWRDGEAYDDWDAMAACLYDNLVVRAISYAVADGRGLELPRYDTIYPSYKGAFIQVEVTGLVGGVTAAFVGFAGTSSDFARVKWVSVSASGGVLDQNARYSPFSACKFCLVREIDGEPQRLHALAIGV